VIFLEFILNNFLILDFTYGSKLR